MLTHSNNRLIQMGSAIGKPTTIRRLVTDLVTFGRREGQYDLYFNSQRPH